MPSNPIPGVILLLQIELLEAASHKDCSPDCLEELFQAVSGHLLGYNGWLQAMPVLLKHLQLSPSDIAETHLAESSRRAAVASNAVVYRLAFLPDLYSEHRDLMHKAIPNLWMWFTHWLSIGYLSDEDVIIDTTALRNASVGMMVLCRSPEFVVPEASDVIIAFFIYSTRGLNLRRAMYRFTGSEEDTEPESESDDTRFRIYEPDNSIVCMLTLIRSCFNLSWAASSQSAAAADIYVALKPLFVPILTCTCIHISLRSSDHKGSYENKAKRVDGLNCLSIMASILERLTPGPSILPEKGLRSIVEHTLRAGLHASLMLSEHHDLQDRSDYAETLQLAFWILRLVFSTPLPAAVAISLVHHGIEKGILSTLAYTDEHIYEYGGSAKQLLRTSPCLEDRRFLLEEVLLSSMWMRPLFKDIIYELELHSTGLVKIRFALDERFEKLKMRWAIFYAQSSALSPSQGRHKRCGNTAVRPHFLWWCAACTCIDTTYAQCAWSKKPPGRIQQCAGCESASYCDHFCQAASWRGDDHRSVCKAAMARRAGACLHG
jgi:hypothetical protein